MENTQSERGLTISTKDKLRDQKLISSYETGKHREKSGNLGLCLVSVTHTLSTKILVFFTFMYYAYIPLTDQ